MKWLFILLFVLVNYIGLSQTYVSIAPSLTNTPATVAGKSNLAIEIGRQWDVFSLGFDIGLTTLSSRGANPNFVQTSFNRTRRDTIMYVELRPNLNIFQVGKFTNTFTAGIGYVFNAKMDLLTEMTYGIEYAYTTRTHLNVFFGQFYYSGLRSSGVEPFFGVSVMYFFKPYTPSSVIKQNN